MVTHIRVENQELATAPSKQALSKTCSVSFFPSYSTIESRCATRGIAMFCGVQAYQEDEYTARGHVLPISSHSVPSAATNASTVS